MLKNNKKKLYCKHISYFFLKVHIEFLDAGDVIKIEGPPTDADKAREILEEQAKELMTKMDFTEINVDAKYHKHIIGKGGSTVNKLKQETEVMINIPDSDKAPSNVIRIEGNKDGVKKAKEVSSINIKILNFFVKTTGRILLEQQSYSMP